MHRVSLLRRVLAIPHDVPLKGLAARHRLLISEIMADLGCVHLQVLIKIQGARRVWRRALFINNRDSPAPPDKRGQFLNPSLQIEPVRFRNVRHVAPRSTPPGGPLVYEDGLAAIVHSLQIGPEASFLAVVITWPINHRQTQDCPW